MDEEIIAEFEEFGLDAPDSEVLDKCIELCAEYDMSAAEFVNQWIAFSVSHLDGANPTLSYLCQLERKDLIPKRDKTNNANSTKNKPSNSKQLMESNNLPNDDMSEEIDDVVDTYCKTPKIRKSVVARTPIRQGDTIFTPLSYSPISNSESPLTSSKNFSGKILYTHGNSNLQNQATWSSTKEEKIILKQILTMSTKCKYMLDNLIDRTYILHDHLVNIAKDICSKVFNTNDTNNFNLQLPNDNTTSTDTVNLIGRIGSDSDDYRLTSASTILIEFSMTHEKDEDEDEDEKEGGKRKKKSNSIIDLDFSKLKSFAAFPGQIVMISGKQLHPQEICVHNMYTQRILKPPSTPKSLDSDLRFVIASGPYTHQDDLVYDPLHDLILYCKNNKPNVLILLGPFVEAEHSMIIGNVLAETFESFFEKIVTGIVEALGHETIICMISSQKDAIANNVYPTPPLTTKNTYSNLHMLSNPCIIDINGITIGATSTDIFTHLLQKEIAVNAGDKVKRIVNYLFHQGSFYPLQPPSLDVCFDYDLASKYAKLEITPNILILPSDSQYFMKDVDNCLAVNPGRLIDSKNNGSFARLIVSPPKAEANASNYMFGQIMKI